MFKYKTFGKIYFQSLVMSIPQIVSGYLCIQYLDLHKLEDQPWFYIGLATSNLFSPYLLNVTRFKLMLVNCIMITIGIIGLIVEDYSNQYIYRILTCIIGFIVGCDWLMTIRYIREQSGWEEDRSIHININPLILFFTGTLIRIIIRKKNIENELDNQIVIISSIAILTNIIRLLGFILLYEKQSLEFYYRQFRELQGRVIIKKLFKGDTKDVEYYYISNNEALSQLHLNTKSLFQKQFKCRFTCCCILSILSWIQLNDLQKGSQDLSDQPFKYFILGFGSIAIISQIVFRFFHIRNVLIILNLMMITQSGLVLLRCHFLDDYQLIMNFSILLVFITYFIGLILMITQQLPYKGINFSINLTFFSFCLASIIDGQLDNDVDVKNYNKQQNNQSLFRYSYLAANILAFPALVKLKNVRNLKEYEIQQIYA